MIIIIFSAKESIKLILLKRNNYMSTFYFRNRTEFVYHNKVEMIRFTKKTFINLDLNTIPNEHWLKTKTC